LGATDTVAFTDDILGNVTITGLPANSSLFNGGHYSAGTNSWTGSAAEFNALSFTAGNSGGYTLAITATPMGANAAGPGTESYTLTVNQALPVLGGATSATGAEGSVVTLGATDLPQFSDDTLGDVTITGVPGDLKGFNGGTYTAAMGTWSGTAAQFNALS